MDNKLSESIVKTRVTSTKGLGKQLETWGKLKSTETHATLQLKWQCKLLVPLSQFTKECCHETISQRKSDVGSQSTTHTLPFAFAVPPEMVKVPSAFTLILAWPVPL